MNRITERLRKETLEMMSTSKLNEMFHMTKVLSVMSILFDVGITLTVAKYNYDYFVANEANSSFVAFIKTGNPFVLWGVILTNLLFYGGYFLCYPELIKMDFVDRIKLGNVMMYTVLLAAIIVINVMHIAGGLSWLL